MTKLAAANLLIAEGARSVYSATLDEGVSLDAVYDPAFWAHVASRFRPLTRIEVGPQDNSWFAELIVLDCDRLWAKVALLRKVDLIEAAKATTAEVAVPAGFKVTWGGPVQKFRVQRGNDILAKDFATKVEAREWIALNAQAAAA